MVKVAETYRRSALAEQGYGGNDLYMPHAFNNEDVPYRYHMTVSDDGSKLLIYWDAGNEWCLVIQEVDLND